MPPTEPLWATSLAGPPRPEQEEPARAEAPPEPEAPREPEAPEHDGPPRGLPVLLVLAVVVLLGAIASVAGGETSASVREVDSYWGSIPLRCRTVRLDPEGRTAELFTCRSTTEEQVPEGLYRPPLSGWQSDIDRRHATDDTIRVDAQGELVGWAFY